MKKEDKYIIIGKSMPISKAVLEYLQKTSSNKNKTNHFVDVVHIESKNEFKAYCIEDCWYHDKTFNKKKIAIYKSSNNSNTTHAIDLDLFLSIMN